MLWLLKIILQMSFIVLVVVDVATGLSGTRWWVWPLWLLPVFLICCAVNNVVHYVLIRHRCLVTHHLLFKSIRHPMYLGDLVMIWSFCLFWPTWLIWFIAIVVSGVIVRLALVEDHQLARRYPICHGLWRRRSRLLC